MDTFPVSASINRASHNARFRNFFRSSPSTENERHHDRQLFNASIAVIHVLSNYVWHYLNQVSLLPSGNVAEIAFGYQKTRKLQWVFKVLAMPNIRRIDRQALIRTS
jgi:hypothetical protein